MEREDYWFHLCNTDGIYHQQIKELLSVFKTPEKIYEVSDSAIENAVKTKTTSFNSKLLRDFIESRKDFSDLSKRDVWERNGIRFISIDNPEYPEKMIDLPDAPYALYVRGKLPEKDEPVLGMVGARACSEYGRYAARKISREAACSGVSIISGMARGIDSLSAEGALDAGGKTYAVLGGGVDIIYPPENLELYYKIAMTGGIISEYKPKTAPVGWQFPLRNRIISGLSDILLVIEAGKRSGTLSTARHALSQNKDIYALPGRISDPLSIGCNSLIGDGAGIFQNTNELVSAILTMHDKIPIAPLNKSGKKKNIVIIPSPVKENKEWLSVYSAIGRGPSGCSEIIKKSNLSPNKVAEILSLLDINGFIKEVSKDMYTVCDFS